LKITILVEGRTEKAFKPHLINFLKPRLINRMPRLDMFAYHGRIPKEGKLLKTVENLFSGSNRSDAVIALTDVYTGTNDFNDAADAKRKMNEWVGNHPNFYPHVAKHDFEAWLLPYWETIKTLARHNRNPPPGLPESVNHMHPPSEHIQTIFENGASGRSYSKPRDANRILTNNDLMIAVRACPELKAFVNRIIELSDGETIK